MPNRESESLTPDRRILAVRLGSMGDVIHTLPAVASLKHSISNCHLAWVVDPKWASLLEANPFVDHVIPFDRRRLWSVLEARRQLRRERFDTVIDFQGLLKSALVASAARPERIFGLHRSQVRERLAALFYSHSCRVEAEHVVDRNIELAEAAGGHNVLRSFPLPPGEPEGKLPDAPFVLACPMAGWGSKQWPLENYPILAAMIRRKLEMALVVNGPPRAAATLDSLAGCVTHYSGIPGLIDATRKAAAVVGVDSGPIHLAAALDRPGVAIFGPTDPARNGPYGDSFTVLRAGGAVTSYKRLAEADESMRSISPEEVFEALAARIGEARQTAGGSS